MRTYRVLGLIGTLIKLIGWLTVILTVLSSCGVLVTGIAGGSALPGLTGQNIPLGGLVAGYLYLKSGRFHPMSEIKYRYLKWRINRMRRKFDVYSGGRADDVNRRVH